MTEKIRQLRAMAQTTAVELFGQPVVLLLILSGIVATALVPMLQLHQFGEPGRLARDSGLAYQLVIGLIVATVTASASIHAETANGTAAAALAKPISRDFFLVGKWLGVLTVTLRFWFCTLSTTMLAERVQERNIAGVDGVDFVTDKLTQLVLLLIPILSLTVAGWLHNRRRARFCKTAVTMLTILLFLALVVSIGFNSAGCWAPSLENTNLRIIPVSLLILAVLGVNSAIAAALSTFLKTAPVLVICLALLFLGLSADTLISPETPLPIRVAAALIPNIQSFWMCDTLTSGGSLSLSYVLRATIYAAAHIAFAFGIGMLVFRKRDIS